MFICFLFFRKIVLDINKKTTKNKFFKVFLYFFRKLSKKKWSTANGPKSKMYLAVGRLAVFLVGRFFIAAHRGFKLLTEV